MSLKFTVIDAFTTKPFCGNPAAIVILPSDKHYEDHILQGIATELNLSQTAFVRLSNSLGDKSDDTLFGLRWFTPTKEVRLCGHGTIATSAILFADEAIIPWNTGEIHFETLSGTLPAKRLVEGSSPADTKYEIEFPAGEVVPASKGLTKTVQDIVAKVIPSEVEITFVGVCDVPPYDYYVLVEIEGRLPLEGMEVNTGLLISIAAFNQPVVSSNLYTRQLAPQYSVIFLCQKASGAPYDIAFRMFAPASGIHEDPVCGSANSFAARYWAERTDTVSGKPMKIRAASSRGGDIDLFWEESTKTAKIRRQVRVASRGEIYV